MEATITRLDTPEVAKLVRKDLRQHFPGVKFSVRSRSYAGGSSIDVRWTDGPKPGDVNAVVNRYQGADFDGMIDLKVDREPTLMANEDGSYEEVRYGVDFVSVHRTVSREARTAIEQEIRDYIGRDFERTERLPISTDRESRLALDDRGEWANVIVDQLAYQRGL